MTATIIVIKELSELPRDVLYLLTYEPPQEGVAYAYQRPDNGRKWRVMYFVVRKEMEG